jgi:hypothetical protein
MICFAASIPAVKDKKFLLFMMQKIYPENLFYPCEDKNAGPNPDYKKAERLILNARVLIDEVELQRLI